jgi:hypothetical protein
VKRVTVLMAGGGWSVLEYDCAQTIKDDPKVAVASPSTSIPRFSQDQYLPDRLSLFCPWVRDRVLHQRLSDSNFSPGDALFLLSSRVVAPHQATTQKCASLTLLAADAISRSSTFA